jgi:hypothetical protein
MSLNSQMCRWLVVAAGHTEVDGRQSRQRSHTPLAPHHPTCTRPRHLAHIHTSHSTPDKSLSFTAEIRRDRFAAHHDPRPRPHMDSFQRRAPSVAPSDGRIAPSDGRVAMPVPRRGPSQPCHPYADMQLSTAEPCSAMGDKLHPYAQLSLALVESLLVSI